MPATADLIENGHVLKYVVTEPWSMEDIYHITRRGKQVYDTSPHRIHLLADVTGIRKVPPGFLSVRHVPDLNHPNSGHIALVGAEGLFKLMAELVARFFPAEKVGYYNSEEEALSHIRSLIDGEEQP